MKNSNKQNSRYHENNDVKIFYLFEKTYFNGVINSSFSLDSSQKKYQLQWNDCVFCIPAAKIYFEINFHCGQTKCTSRIFHIVTNSKLDQLFSVNRMPYTSEFSNQKHPSNRKIEKKVNANTFFKRKSHLFSLYKQNLHMITLATVFGCFFKQNFTHQRNVEHDKGNSFLFFSLGKRAKKINISCAGIMLTAQQNEIYCLSEIRTKLCELMIMCPFQFISYSYAMINFNLDLRNNINVCLWIQRRYILFAVCVERIS